MRKLSIILTSVLFFGCTATYSVTTDSDYQEVKNQMLDIFHEYGYTLVSSESTDTNIYVVGGMYARPGFWVKDTYTIEKDDKTETIDVYSHRKCISEAKMIPYVETCNVGCSEENEVCNAVTSLMSNPPKSEVKVTKETWIGGVVGFTMALPILVLILCSALG